MAIILPHDVLFRGGAKERIRTKLLKDSNIDTVIRPAHEPVLLIGHPGLYPAAQEVQEPR